MDDFPATAVLTAQDLNRLQREMTEMFLMEKSQRIAERLHEMYPPEEPIEIPLTINDRSGWCPRVVPGSHSIINAKALL